MDIQELLVLLKDKKVSDLHLSEGLSPYIRMDNELERLNLPPLEKDHIWGFALDYMDEREQNLFLKEGSIDFSISWQELRLRLNLFKQSRGLSLAIRFLAEDIPNFKNLNLPPEIVFYQDGLVLLAGPTGSGKSTTLASLIEVINQQQKKHIITIEDPIEYIYQSKQSLIQQKEIGKDALSFSEALKGVLREDPDIILIGELRTLETIRLALTAAETGHLVLASIHSPSATKTIHRIIDVFPSEEKAMIRSLLAESLKAIIAQRLYKKREGGRVMAAEILINNQAIRHLIREDKIGQIYSLMQTGSQHKMQTMEQAFDNLMAQYLV